MNCDKKEKLLGFVYVDQNSNGKLDPLEKGIKANNVLLLNPEKEVVFSTQTSDLGKFEFDVCKSDYIIKVELEKGSNATLDRNEIIVNKDNFTTQHNFKVVQGSEHWSIFASWVGVSILGLVLIYMVFKHYFKSEPTA